MPTALVTGGAGFIGSHVADLLLAHGWQVAVVDDLSSGRRENVPPQARFYHLDVRDPGLGEVLERERPDFVSHQAAQISVVRSVADPAHDAAVNILGLIALLQACVGGGVRKVAFASTGGALYGDVDAASLPLREDCPVAPVSPYGISKAACEHYLRFFRSAHGLAYVSLRYANVYGPRQDPHGEAGVVAILCGAMRARQPVRLYGHGAATRDYVHVRDVARANYLALTSDIDHGAFNISTGRETAVREVFDALAEFYGYAQAPQLLPLRTGEVERIALDNRAAGRALGWQPEVELRQGLVETAEHFAQRE